MAVERDGGGLHFDRGLLKGGIWLKIYDLLIPFALLIARLLSLRNDKIRTALKGRKGGVKNWHFGKDNGLPVVLIHVSSAGEYEGARPLIDKLNFQGKTQIAVSYSSPSAKPVVEGSPGLYAHGYLPTDYLVDQLRFLAQLDPVVVLVFKHDFWPNTIRAAHALNIPFGVVNANFHAKTRRNLPMIRGFHRAFMKNIKFIWTVSEKDSSRIEKLLSVGTELKAMGDSRYDRVLIRAEQGKERFRKLKAAYGKSQVIIAGSTWPPGENIIWEAFARLRHKHPGLKLLIAPHEPTQEALDRNREQARKGRFSILLLSEWKGETIAKDVLIVDSVGILADIYTVGWAAYVGGGFGKGVHSVIEPAAHGLPVAFGPNYYVSHEAGLLVINGGGQVVETAEDLSRIWGNWLRDTNAYTKAASAAKNIVNSNAGVTDRLVERIEKYISQPISVSQD